MKDDKQLVGTKTAHLTTQVTLKVQVPIYEGQTEQEALDAYQEGAEKGFEQGAAQDPEVAKGAFLSIEWPF